MGAPLNVRLAQRAQRFCALVAASAGIFCTTGCASFSGMPEPVISVETATTIPQNYLPAEAGRRFYSPNPADRENLSPEQWRNTVVLVRMAAADARYQDFRQNLSQEIRGANFGIEATVLGLSAVGTVSGQGLANALAAAVAALTGARASLSREVYFERTLPALIAGMEVSRLEIATRILSNLGRPANQYSIERAMLDALAYERAASLDEAIQRVTVQAAGEVQRQQQIYEDLENQVGIIGSTERPLVSRIRDNINALVNANDDAAIAKIMARLGLPRNGDLQAQSTAALLAIGRLSVEERTRFVEDMRAQQVELGRAAGSGG
jgi:hypothetical protein